MRRRTVAGAALGTALVVAACGGSTGDTQSSGANPPNDSAATFATVPTTWIETRTQTAPTDQTAESATTIPLEPAANVDLPTASPEELANGPSTTAATGPLPVPSVSLVKVAEFDTPVELTTRPGDARSFVVEQGGRVLAFDDLSTEVVLDITDRTAANGERGLLGAAFDPAADRAYVHYSDESGDTVLAEYAIDPVTAIFDIESRREVLTVEQPFGNHNGGELAFGPDGYLYLALGDGGAADDPERNSLALSSRLGKILRIDPKPTAKTSFATPQDNPFVDVDGADPTIWSLGLRNPWKFSFDSLTGDLWIADVGQGDIEEINHAPAVDGQGAGKGLSFGWSAFEGSARFNSDQDGAGHTGPVVEYLHEDGNCSVSGGAIYRGDVIEDLFGWYVFGDFCSGRIWGYDPTSRSGEPLVIELAELASLTAIAVGGEGELFALSNAGTVSRFSSV
ncbi:PQQ-dependent sugar dehydrogenase [uncultured Ilumatobacter sp.]|uniref:PQQ-dependent sugar dehydrogenase n=1 Tax=uncultured Ilumatobacter sp. TaxID=879968 RepID=UPI00374F97DE